MRSQSNRFVALAILAVLIFAPGCANNVKPETTVLQYGSKVVQTATALQVAVTAATDAKSITVAQGQTLTGYNEKLYAKAALLKNATDAYHAATELATRRIKAGEISNLVADMNGLVGSMLAVELPQGFVAELNKSVGNVMLALGAVQAEVARGLGATQ